MVERVSTIVAKLAKVPGVQVICLFGSYASGQAKADSDYNVAILFDHAEIPKPLDLIVLREELADELEKSVDLVCLNTCSPILGMQIYKHGYVLHGENSKPYAYYLMRLFTDYADLRRLRQPMEKSILNRRLYD